MTPFENDYATLISSHFKHKISTKGPRYFMGELFLIWNFVDAPLEDDYATLTSDHLAIWNEISTPDFHFTN